MTFYIKVHKERFSTHFFSCCSLLEITASTTSLVTFRSTWINFFVFLLMKIKLLFVGSDSFRSTVYIYKVLSKSIIYTKATCNGGSNIFTSFLSLAFLFQLSTQLSLFQTTQLIYQAGYKSDELLIYDRPANLSHDWRYPEL